MTVPATAPPGPETVKLDAPMDDAFMVSLKTAVMAAEGATPVAALTGVTDVTVGAAGGVLVLETEPPQPETARAARQRVA